MVKFSTPAFFFLIGSHCVSVGDAFVTKPDIKCRHKIVTCSFVSAANRVPLHLHAANADHDLDTRSFLLSREEVSPVLTFGEGAKEKVVNRFGLWCLVISLLTGPIWMAAMKIVEKLPDDADNNRSLYDKTGKVWAKVWLSLTGSFPTVTGNLDRLKAGDEGGACLFVANHASWLDIPVLCTVLDPVFKFIAKGELTKVPCIGTQLEGGDHILIDREDRRSQLKTFKQGISWLKKGVPLMAFPEGQRSKDGHLMEFKGGLFAMASKTSSPVIPITISHAHAVMPSNSFFPVQPGRGKLHIHVHDPIESTGRSEEELAEEVRAAFLQTLPLEQHPLQPLPLEQLHAAMVTKAPETSDAEQSAVAS